MSKYTQKEIGGLYELTDAARAELSSSKYTTKTLLLHLYQQEPGLLTTLQCFGSECPYVSRPSQWLPHW